MRVWFPVARGDEWQEVRIVSAKGDLPLQRTRESEYGNLMYYAATPKAEKDEYLFEVVYDVVRSERIGLREGSPVGGGPRLNSGALQRFLAPDRACSPRVCGRASSGQQHLRLYR